VNEDASAHVPFSLCQTVRKDSFRHYPARPYGGLSRECEVREGESIPLVVLWLIVEVKTEITAPQLPR